MIPALHSDRVTSHACASTHQQVLVPAFHGRPVRIQKLEFRSKSNENWKDVRALASNGFNNGRDRVKIAESSDTGVTANGRAGTDFVAETLLPTRNGKFRLRGYRHTMDGVSFTEPTAIIYGDVEGQKDVTLRVHDACFTSEVLGSLKCDCAEQLQLALEFIQKQPPGMVIYLQQEGRGIGLANKIAAYALQEKGLDTVDANRALGLPDDCREYSPVPNILKDLGIKSIQLMTNNPRKIGILEGLGVTITGRIPCVVQAGEYNQGYLDAKEKRMDHLLDGSWCYWNHDGEPMQPTSSNINTGFGYSSPLNVGRILDASKEGDDDSAGD